MKPSAQAYPTTVTVHVPLRFTVRGGRKTIIGEIPHTSPRTRFDDSITKALARAHRWRSLIEDGRYMSITELANDKRVNQSYACRLIRLTQLAPDIVEAILNQQGVHLTLDKLMKPLPCSWAEQRSYLNNKA